jgi:hypothetical protein
LDKEEFNRRDAVGARHTDAMHFRMPKRLAIFIKTLALIEGSDSSKIARRFLTNGAMEEGYDPDGF